MSQVICYLCGQKGHYKQDCTLNADKKQHFPTQQQNKDSYTNVTHTLQTTTAVPTDTIGQILKEKYRELENKPTISQGLPTI